MVTLSMLMNFYTVLIFYIFPYTDVLSFDLDVDM